MIVEWWHLVLLAALWFFAGLIWSKVVRKPLNYDHQFQDHYLPKEPRDD